MAKNQTKRSLLTPDRLASLRSSIQRVKPWQAATGPRTAAGKARSRMNALKHGLRSAEVVASRKELASLLREVREIIAFDRLAAEYEDTQLADSADPRTPLCR